MRKKYYAEDKTGTFICEGCGRSFFATYKTMPPKYHDRQCHKKTLAKRKAKKRKELRETENKKPTENGEERNTSPASVFGDSIVEIPDPLVGQGSEQSRVVKMGLPPMFLHQSDAMPAMFLSR